MNKIEEYKKEKAGLDILADVPRYASEGWKAITDGDKERLKWAGVFFRRQTPGHFMMRLRLANGIMTAPQLRALGQISQEFGKGFADITTRQQIQLRWFTINDVPEIWNRLSAVNLVSLQTGMDNIRGVIGCPVAGFTPNELFDASPVVPATLAALIARVVDGTLSNNGARQVFDALWGGEGAEVDALIAAKGLKQMNDAGALEVIVDAVLAANAKSVDEYRAGKDKAFNALVGQVMKASKGQANPAQASELLKKKLGA